MTTLSYMIDHFLQLESRVWSALVSGDSSADAALLDDGFLGVYTSGFAGKDDHVGQLIDGPTIARFELLQARIMNLASETVLLSYRANYARCDGDRVGEEEVMYVTSIWQLVDGKWKNIFSQDTPSKGEHTR